MSEYNLETHPNYVYLKDHLKNFKAVCFSDFIKETDKLAKKLSKPDMTNQNNYAGFDIFDKAYYDWNDMFLQEEFSKDVHSKVVGDVLEIFCAFFLQYFESDTTFGIKRGSYVFGQDLSRDLAMSDYGCDGRGELLTNHSKAFVQVKYRSNPKDKPFSVETFTKLFTDAAFYGMDHNDPSQRLIFFTNISVGEKESWDAKTGPFLGISGRYKIQTALIGKNEISKLVGGSGKSNENFWEMFKKSV